MVQSPLRRFTKFATVTNAVLAFCATVAGLLLTIALTTPPSLNPTPSPVNFSAIEDSRNRLSSAEALRTLSAIGKIQEELATNRSEAPFWLLSEHARTSSVAEEFLEFPSRHIQEISYWFIGSNDRVVGEGKIDRISQLTNGARRIRAGFAIPIPRVDHPLRILAQVRATGPARISLALQTPTALEATEQYFDRSGGILYGSLLMIAAFSVLIALLSRDFTFFLFGAWVVSSLRFASYSTGWDLGWLGYDEAETFPVLVKNLPLAAYALFTVTLFYSIFRKDIALLRATKYVRVLLALATSLVFVSLLLPHRFFLPVLWAVVTPSVIALMWLTVRIFIRTGSAAAAWYGASWIATLLGALSEVAFAAGVTSSKPTLLNSLGAAIVSALLAGISIALRLNAEKSGRLSAQAQTVSVLRKFHENYNSMPVGLFSVDDNGNFSLYNPAFSEMFQIPETHSEGTTFPVDKLLGAGAHERLRAAGVSGGDVDVEFQIVTEDEPDRWFLARVTSRAGSIEGSIQDITTRKEAEKKLRHLVDHDSLTDLLNRRGLETALKEARVAAGRMIPCAIAHVDLDRFKLVNDLYGHAVGDAVIAEAASRLTRTIRGRDHVARMADSFVIVFLDCPEHAVAGLTERLRESISDFPFELHEKSLNMTVSIGVVTIDPVMTALDAMTAANRACTEAKARGRNCVVRLNDKDATLTSHLEELKVVAGLQQRIPTDRYFLEFQPIVSLRSSRTSLNYEVLIRMRDEQGGVVPPGRFIGAAERNGLMSQIDRWVLRSTLEWLDDHPEHRDRLTFATINISGASLNDARFVDDAFAMIAEHPLAVNKLCFEITESVALNDIGSTRRFVDRVRVYGSKLALDDFGAGYTSFNYLKEIPADFIKIDGSFVRDINRNPANYAITRTIVDLTHELGMSSIAEWAETPDTIASLLELRVDYAQGFCLARPLAKEILAGANSSGAVIRDPHVISLLDASAKQFIVGHAAGNRRT